jgi:hypothetical protein
LAKERFKKARQAVKDREDDVDWALFELQAFEVADEAAHQAEQAARGRVTIEHCQKAHDELNNPDSRENQLLRQVTSAIAELVPLISERKSRHTRLAQELQYIPKDQLPLLKGGSLVAPATSIPVARLVRLPHEIFDAIGRAGIEIGGR